MFDKTFESVLGEVDIAQPMREFHKRYIIIPSLPILFLLKLSSSMFGRLYVSNDDMSVILQPPKCSPFTGFPFNVLITSSKHSVLISELSRKYSSKRFVVFLRNGNILLKPTILISLLSKYNCLSDTLLVSPLNSNATFRL